jgi:hypothetical protein
MKELILFFHSANRCHAGIKILLSTDRHQAEHHDVHVPCLHDVPVPCARVTLLPVRINFVRPCILILRTSFVFILPSDHLMRLQASIAAHIACRFPDHPSPGAIRPHSTCVSLFENIVVA